MIIGIDPGPEKSALVVWDSEEEKITHHQFSKNEEVLDYLIAAPSSYDLAVEMIEGMGQAVGASVFYTCVWIGRFVQVRHDKWSLIPRKSLKRAITGNTNAKDKDIRRALLSRLGKEATKGIVTHRWQALAVALVGCGQEIPTHININDPIFWGLRKNKKPVNRKRTY